ncbi:MAG TPA: hypothetical protein VGT98_07145 [Candidatus Elarobacter sp.]|nr:hypothetical protein [Candidatus Elarobacter sp.]HEV2738680.1 hypothetical protein [Candidatus Elarobacter sp.]
MAEFDTPVGFWPDPYTKAVAEADPHSALFREFVGLAMRAELDTPDHFFAGADVASVLGEQDVNWHDLGLGLEVPPVYMYAVYRGWKRLGLRGLSLIAEAVGVPLAAFMVDANGVPRIEVRRYNAYRLVAPYVTILGGD